MLAWVVCAVPGKSQTWQKPWAYLNGFFLSDDQIEVLKSRREELTGGRRTGCLFSVTGKSGGGGGG